MSDIVIRVENLGKAYKIAHSTGRGRYKTLQEDLLHLVKRPFSQNGASKRETFWALKDVSFEVKQGEVLGIIGRNGAGKSTLLKILSRITRPTTGYAQMNGRVGSLLEVGTGFHPELTGRENIFLNGAVLGMSRRDIQHKFDEIVAFAEVEYFLDTPVKRYSSGMYMRLAFAVAAHLEPEILVVDEVLAVGDAEFQKKSLGKMGEVAQSGRTVLFVSHNLSAIKSLCNRAILLENGNKTFDGDVLAASALYLRADDTHETDTIYWDAEHAPASRCARLLEVNILNDGKLVGSQVLTELPIQIAIRFQVIEDQAKVGTSIRLFTTDGTLTFVSISNHEPEWHMRERPRGIYRSICEIPANFLADGSYSLSVVLWDGNYQDGITENDVLVFRAHEKGYIRGDYPSQIKGSIYPLLKWTSRLEREAELASSR